MCPKSIFRNEKTEKQRAQAVMPDVPAGRPLRQTALYFASLVGLLIFANWGAPQNAGGVWSAIYQAKWAVTAGFGIMLAVILVQWFGVRWWKVTAIGLATIGAALLFPENLTVHFANGLI